MNIALLFPGQGAQKIGMGKDLFDNFAAARMAFEEASESIKLNLQKLCFDGPDSELMLTENTQPAVLTTSIAILKVLHGETGMSPAIVAGHSLGEYTAIVCAGGLELADAVRIVKLRGKFMQEAVPEGEGAMAAILGLDAEKLDALCRDVADETSKVVVPANYNSPDQIVISGHAQAVEKAQALAIERGAKRAVPLKVSAPFHSPLMKPAAEKLEPELAKLKFRNTSCPVISNVDASTHSKAPDFAPLLTKQVTAPVRWSESMTRLAENEIELAIEVGPGKVLTGLMRNINRDIKTANVEDMQSLKKILQSTGNA